MSTQLASAVPAVGAPAYVRQRSALETADAAALDAGWYERTMRGNLQALVDHLP